MTGKDLQAHYRAELARMLGPEAGRHVNRKTTAWMLKHAAATEGGIYTPETGARTWIWSDLHLHHKNIIRYCSRPFQSVETMNESLLAAWKETVSEADTIICGGDIALAGALERERLARVRAMPGRKLLVRGNHDFGRNGRPADTGSDATWMALVITGNPTLVVTHIAMNEVPDGTVNLYGHVHNNEPLREGPYVNICVEHTEYPAPPARRRPTAGPGTTRRPAAAGGDDGRGNPLPGDVVNHMGRKRWTETNPGGGTAETRVSPAWDGADPRRTGYDVSAMIEDTSPTVIGTIIVSFYLASRPSFSTYCSATAQLHGLRPVSRPPLKALGELVEHVGHLVAPVALRGRLRPDIAHRGPEAECAVANCHHRRAQTTAAQIPQYACPTLRALSIAVLERHQFLGPVRSHPEYHQRAQPVLFTDGCRSPPTASIWPSRVISHSSPGTVPDGP